MLVNVPTFADILGVTQYTVKTYIAQGMPAGSSTGSGKKREFDSGLAIQWLIDQKVAEVAPTDDEQESADEADRRRKIANASLIELELAQKRGDLIPMAVAENVIDRAFGLVATQLDGLAGRLAAELAAVSDAAVIRQVLFDETRRIRAAAAAELANRAIVQTGGSEDQSASAEDDSPVGEPESSAAAG